MFLYWLLSSSKKVDLTTFGLNLSILPLYDFCVNSVLNSFVSISLFFPVLLPRYLPYPLLLYLHFLTDSGISQGIYKNVVLSINIGIEAVKETLSDVLRRFVHTGESF